MTYWPFWASGLALAGVALFHWLTTSRLLAVSGAVTTLVNRVRFGRQEEVDPGELFAALREKFPDAAPIAPSKTILAARSVPAHLLLLGGLVLGGAISHVIAGTWHVVSTLDGPQFAALARRVPAPIVLFGGGALVGFGTRMAGGCTSGHGLCGVSRLQSGSLVTTAAFFGAGVAVSMLLARLL